MTERDRILDPLRVAMWLILLIVLMWFLIFVVGYHIVGVEETVTY